MKNKIGLLLAGIFCMPCLMWGKIPDTKVSGPVLLGDPFIMLFEGRYYAYGTYAENGIQVLVSEDLKEWEIADVKDGLALRKEDVWGDC